MDQIQGQGSTPSTDNPQAIGLPSLEPAQSGLQNSTGSSLLHDDSLSQKVQLKVEACTQNCVQSSTPTPAAKNSDMGWWLIGVIMVVTALAVAAQFINFKELINGQKKIKKQ